MAKPLHILFLPKWYPHDAEPFDGNFIENYAHALKQRMKISVIFVHSAREIEDYSIEKTKNEGMEEIRVFFPKKESGVTLIDKATNAYRYQKAQKLGFAALSDKEIDLCHIHVLSRSGYLALKLRNKFKIPFVISEHWSGYHAEVGEYKGATKKVFTQRLCKASKGIHTVSSRLKSSMQSHDLHNAYTVIPNVVDTELFSPAHPKNDQLELLFVGNLIQEVKQILDIIEVVAHLHDRYPHIRLSIYGEGKDEEACRERIHSLGKEDVIRLKGVRPRAEIADIMAHSDVLLLYSAYENQPCVINEALSCGLPVVVPNIEGIVEFTNEDVALLYPKNDRKAFQDALESFIQKPEQFDRNVVRTFAVEHFSEEKIAERFHEFYQKALSS